MHPYRKQGLDSFVEAFLFVAFDRGGLRKKEEGMFMTSTDEPSVQRECACGASLRRFRKVSRRVRICT